MQISHSKLRDIYMPNLLSRMKVEKFFALYKSRFDRIIGVHIRRGDYKKWENGRFYFFNNDFLGYMKQLQLEMQAQNLKCGFLLCSNEPFNPADFKPLDVFQIDEPNAIEDLYGLSLCDFILGPPSSYSMWASFYGKKPIYFMRDRNSKLSIADFKVIAAQNVYENGEKVRF